MTVPMVQAFIEGYQERLFDNQCLAVQQGYWAGYYQSKKPKSANSVIEKMIRDHDKSRRKKHNAGKNIPKPEVDMDRFLRLEQKRMEFLARKKGREANGRRNQKGRV